MINKKSPNEIDNEIFSLARKTAEVAQRENLDIQQIRIKSESTYSDTVNEAFSGYEEYEFIKSLGLEEAYVTREALIRPIDFNLFISFKNKTNYELMLDGEAPYLTDQKDDYIVLHHIGQAYDAPFAELSYSEHALYGNSKVLHSTKIESWRNDNEKENQFLVERRAYWKCRATQKVSYSKEKGKGRVRPRVKSQKSIIEKIKAPLDTIFSACSVDDLRYIANLANGFILTKNIGGKTIEEFVLSTSSSMHEPIKCPACSSKNYIYFGYQETLHERKQRYRCNDCGNVFSLFKNAIISGTKLSFMQWIQFIECLYNAYSLEKTAYLCNISVRAAFENRIKLFYALKVLESRVELKGDIVIDEKYFVKSHKGNRGNDTFLKLKRSSRKRGGENRVPGTSKEQVCVVCAIDGYNNSVAKVTGFGNPTAEKIDFVLKKHIESKNIISLYSDCSGAIARFARINNYPIKQTVLKRKSKFPKKAWINRYLQKINSYHSRLEKFLGAFNGVSSELIEGYMCLFSWRDRNRTREPIEAFKELLGVMAESGLYKTADQIIEEKIIESAEDIENKFVTKNYELRNFKKHKSIYDSYIQGISVKVIAKKEGVSTQRIYKILGEFRKKGYAYGSPLQKKETRDSRQWEIEMFEKSLETFQRNYEIYLESEAWKGDRKDFLKSAGEKYSLSVQTIKNIICEVKRILRLRKSFYIYEEYEHLTLRELFEKIHNRYNDISMRQPELLQQTKYDLLAEEFGYSRIMIINIITSMQKDSINWTKKTKIKTPVSQGLNRDISIFIDFMKWTGDKKEFYDYVKTTYGICADVTRQILRMNCLADPSRFELIKRY